MTQQMVSEIGRRTTTRALDAATKRQYTLADMAAQVRQRQERLAPLDIIENLRDFRYIPTEEAIGLLRSEDMELNLNEHAFKQLAQSVGVPGSFALRCPDDMRQEIMDYWMDQTGDKNVLLRTINTMDQPDTIRAVLGERYAITDDDDLAPIIADVVGNDIDDGAVVQFADQGDEYSHFRIIFPRFNLEPRKGDLLQAGVHITNSEVGSRAWAVNAFVYRLLCTNGMVGREVVQSYRFRHVGDSTKLLDNVAGALRAVRTGSVELMERYGRAAETGITDEQVKAVMDRLQEEQKVTKPTREQIAAIFSHYEDKTLYGLVNAVTETARDLSSTEARYNLEGVANRLLFNRSLRAA